MKNIRSEKECAEFDLEMRKEMLKDWSGFMGCFMFLMFLGYCENMGLFPLYLEEVTYIGFVSLVIATVVRFLTLLYNWRLECVLRKKYEDDTDNNLSESFSDLNESLSDLGDSLSDVGDLDGEEDCGC